MTLKKIALTLLLGVATCVSAFAQSMKVTGKVVDSTGAPIIGANVVQNGAKGNGTITDVNGEFSLTVPSKSNLQVSFIGYATQTVTVNGKSKITVTLLDDEELLSEVVVVGYGVEKKVNVVGSISQVSAKKLENRSTPSATNAITGMMPGVTVRQTSGSPGEDSGEIRVRGVGSFGATPSALVLIDGIPGDLSTIHMDDIEQISVLKDASTAAIYGSRAANGVILVTTKSGKDGNAKVSYNGYAGFSNPTALPQFTDTWEYATLRNIAAPGSYTDEEIQKFKTGSDPDNYANEQAMNSLFRTGFQTGHDFSVSGGNAKTKYMVSVGVLNQRGILEKNDYTRYNTRVNLVTDLWPRVTLTSRLQGTRGIRNQPEIPYGKDSEGMLYIVQDAMRWPGTVPTRLQNGEFSTGMEGYGTSLSWFETKSFNKYTMTNASINENLAYRPFDGMTINLIGAYDYTGDETKDFRSTYKTVAKTSTANKLSDEQTSAIYKTFQATATYDKTFGKHGLNVLAGYSYEQQDNRYVGAIRFNLPSDDYPEIDTGDSDTAQNSGGGYGWSLQSVFGRLKYNYSEKYFLDVTARYDGSSRFPKDNRYAFFPSAAIGWRLSEESFIKDNFESITNLKLKASAGKLGNQNIGNYPYQSVFESGYNYPIGSSLAPGVAITTAVDNTLHWEETSTIDAGVELSLWNGLLEAEADFFYRKTTGILYQPSSSVSNIFGFSLSEMNMGELSNKGLELQLTHKNHIGKFNYNISGNLSFISNKVLTLGLGDVDQGNGLIGDGTYFKGYAVDSYYGYVTDGVFLTDDEVSQWPDQTKINPSSQAGDIRFVDTNGDGKVTTTDRVILGTQIPKVTYGLILSGDWRGLDFSLQLQGVAGNKGYLTEYAGTAFYQQGGIQRWIADGFFNPENPTRYPSYPRLENIGTQSKNTTVTSDFFLQNASYMRIKNVQLGYSLPFFSNKTFVKTLRIYAQAENLFTFNHFPEGWDPEINSAGVYYPILRTITFGLNLGF